MVIPPGFARVFALFEIIGGHDCQNVVDFAVDPNPDQSDVDAASATIGAAYKAQLNSGSLYQGLRVLVGNDGDPTLLESTSGAGVGTRGLALCPPQTQGLITKKTALAGRRNRGRIFIPDMAESQVGDLGDINSTGQGLLDGIAAAWLSLDAAPPWLNPVILHSDGGEPTEVIDMLESIKVATLRRRYER